MYVVLSLALFGQSLLPGRVMSASDQLWAAAPWTAFSPPLSRPLGANAELNDSVQVFEPFLEHTREGLPGVQLWNPHIMSGRPFVANAQSAVFSPFSVPSYVLPRRLAPAASAAMKVFVAALGTYLLARALGIGFAGALLAGTVFGFGQAVVAWVTWPQSSIYVLLPWLLVLTDRVVRHPTMLAVAALAAAVGVQFVGGHPETSSDVLVVTAGFAVYCLARVIRAGRPIARPALAFAGALVLGTALAAVAIAPFAELLLNSFDLESRGALAGGRVSPDYLLGVMLPTYWGRPGQTSIWLAHTQMVGRPFYAGALPLMLAVVALTRPTPGRIALALLGLGSLAVVVGFEPFISIANALPGPVRTDRLAFLFLFGLALLAGWGLDDLLGPRVGATRAKVVLAVSAALVCFPLLYLAASDWASFDHRYAALTLAWGFHVPAEALVAATRDQVVHLSALLEWLPLAAAGLALLGLRLRCHLPAIACALLAVSLTAVDLLKLNVGYNPSLTRAEAFQPSTGAIRYLQRKAVSRFAAVDRPGFAGGFRPLPGDVAMRYGLYDARGRDFPVIDRYADWWSRNIAPVPPAPTLHLPSPGGDQLHALGLLSVAYLVQDPRDPPLKTPGLTTVYDEVDARIYLNRQALPRAFVVDHQTTAATADAALAHVSAADFDGRKTVITEQRVPGVPTGGPTAGSGSASASITTYAADQVTVQASAPRPSVLVLNDSYFPGWKAEIDGEPADVRRVNYLVRGVRLPAGRHEVTFSYRPDVFRAGLATSAVAIVVLLALTIGGLRRRRRPR